LLILTLVSFNANFYETSGQHLFPSHVNKKIARTAQKCIGNGCCQRKTFQAPAKYKEKN
jgi:hypothetical protein